jgi:hypothetical protein
LLDQGFRRTVELSSQESSAKACAQDVPPASVGVELAAAKNVAHAPSPASAARESNAPEAVAP